MLLLFLLVCYLGLRAGPVAAQSAQSAVVGNDIFLEGKYISVGVSGAGSFGTANNAPSGFHPVGSRSTIGLSIDQDGFGTGSAATTGDFFLPGTPEEGFTVGFRRVSSSGTASNFTNAERRSTTQIPRTSQANNSSGDSLKAQFVGETTDSRLRVTQVLSFHKDNKFFKATITLTNIASETLYSVRYMRSFDPDQDSDLNSVTNTVNQVVANFPDSTRAIVKATGPSSNVPVFFVSFDSRSRASTFGFSNRDVYAASAYATPATTGASVTADQAITITFDVGDLAQGASQTFVYYTSLDANLSTSLSTIQNAATALVFSTQPAGATHGQVLTTQPVVQARDDNGNVVTSFSAVVTLSGGGGATVGGSTTATAVNGVATFSGVSVSGGGSNRTLSATATGASSGTSAAFTVDKAAATVAVQSARVAYDGNSKNLTATTTPSGLAVTITYSSSGSAPTEPGTFTGTATVNDANYQGSASGTLVIDSPPPPKAILNASTLRGHAPLTVRFSEASTGYSNYHLVEFFDGRLAGYRNLRPAAESSSVLAPVDLTYNRPGIYDLFLTVKGPGGTDGTLVTVVVEAWPVLRELSAQVGFAENALNDQPALLDSTVSLSDTDSPDLAGGYLLVSYASGGGAEDQLSVRSQGEGPGQISVAGGEIRYGGAPIATLPLSGEGSGVAGQSLRLTFGAKATIAAIEALVERLAYQNLSDQPNSSRTLAVVVADSGAGGTPTPTHVEVAVTAEADEVARFFIDTAAGGGTSRVEGAPASGARLNLPFGICALPAGEVFIAETGSHRIRKITAEGRIITAAGSGKRGRAGDTGPALQAQLADPRGVAVAGTGELYIADTGNHRIRKVDAQGVITTVAGTGEAGFGGDGGPATQARLRTPWGVWVTPGGELYVADTGNHRIRKVAADGTISTVAGTGEAGFGGDGAQALGARLNSPSAVVVGETGALYIADTNNHRIRKVDAQGMATTVAGNGTLGFSGDGGPAGQAQLAFPRGIALGLAGELYVADTFNRKIRLVTTDSTISTVAGSGRSGFGGDTGLGELARLNFPFAVAAARQGQVYVADTINNRIRRLDERLVPLKELARLLSATRAKIAGGEPKWHGSGISLDGELVRGLFGADAWVGDDDLRSFKRHFGRGEDDAAFDPAFDLNGDGVVNMDDFFLISDDFGREAAGDVVEP